MLASYLDHTNLKPEATRQAIDLLCQEALKYKMAAVCVNPYRLQMAAECLAGSEVGLCTVIGFPLGADTTSTKLSAARDALVSGADELDMVINIGALKDRDYSIVKKEILSLLELKQDYRFQLKVIVETALLTRDELVTMTVLVSETGADYIKTSTGFSSRGVSLEDISIIREHKNDRLKIKASGGVKDLDFALRLVNAGVDRIGSSNAGQLVEEYRKRGGR